MALDEKLRRALRLFNEKAEELRASRFVEMTADGLGLKVTFGAGTHSAEHKGPDTEAVKALVLTMRFFIQNNEASSFANLAAVYEDASVSAGQRIRFKQARDALNDHLDGKSCLVSGEEELSHRQILEAVVYGHLAHANVGHEEKYRTWSEGPFGEVMRYEFVSTLVRIVGITLYVREINEELLSTDPSEGAS